MSTIQIPVFLSNSGDQDVGTWSLISDFEVLKNHQSDVDGDAVKEKSGEGRLGRNQRQTVLLGINFSPFVTEYLKLIKIFQIIEVDKA